MAAAAVLLFVLTWGVATALVTLASMGAAPLWFLVGAPLLLATFVAAVAVASVRAERPETGAGSKRRRFVRRVERAGQQALDGLAFTLPLAALSLGFVWVLPLSDAAENATVGPAMVCAAVGGFVVARSIRRSTEAAE